MAHINFLEVVITRAGGREVAGFFDARWRASSRKTPRAN
jgi:hypothetical protein